MNSTPKLAFIALILLSITTLIGWLNATYALAAGLLLGWLSSSNYQFIDGKTLGKWAALLLKVAIVALGFTLPITELVSTAKSSFWLTLGVISGTLIGGLLIANLLKLNSEQSWLISSGTAICGGSAIAAVGSSINANQSNMVLSLAIVFILNAVALLVYPLVGNWLELSQLQFGLWSAIGIHDTSSVVGAASQFGNEALQVATTTKLSRALWIIPIALLASVIHSKNNKKVSIPWFIILFIVASIIGSNVTTGAAPTHIQIWVKNVFALSLLWMGASLNKESIKSISAGALSLGLILWLLISLISLAIIYWYF